MYRIAVEDLVISQCSSSDIPVKIQCYPSADPMISQVPVCFFQYVVVQGQTLPQNERKQERTGYFAGEWMTGTIPQRTKKPNQCGWADFIKLLFFYFLISCRYISSALTIDGAFGAGAFTSSLRPLSSIAFDVVGPKAPINVPFCLKAGSCSNSV